MQQPLVSSGVVSATCVKDLTSPYYCIHCCIVTVAPCTLSDAVVADAAAATDERVGNYQRQLLPPVPSHAACQTA